MTLFERFMSRNARKENRISAIVSLALAVLSTILLIAHGLGANLFIDRFNIPHEAIECLIAFFIAYQFAVSLTSFKYGSNENLYRHLFVFSFMFAAVTMSFLMGRITWPLFLVPMIHASRFSIPRFTCMVGIGNFAVITAVYSLRAENSTMSGVEYLVIALTYLFLVGCFVLVSARNRDVITVSVDNELKDSALKDKEKFLEEQKERLEEIETLNKDLQVARAEADAANNAKTTFLNNMSHDIRTPMNAILGFAKLMEKETENPAAIKDYLEKIERSGEYLLSIINNVLEVARIDSGKEEVDEILVDMSKPNGSVMPLLDAELKNRNIKFTVAMNVQHFCIYADPGKIKEITMNLLSNAIKYTPDGGHVHMEFKEIPCEREGYGTFVTTVSDTGIGMSEDFQKHLFEAFSRERNTTQSKIHGTGLGMAIVKRLVDLLGGKIEVKSELGKGTTFTVYIDHRLAEAPKAQAEQAPEPVKKERIDLNGMNILLAEDNELNAEIAIELLGDIGANVEHAKDGVVCVDILCRAEPDYYDLILMDIQMPNLDGYGATRTIRQLGDPQRANIPIVAMTANAFEEDKRKAFESGMNAHVAKPFDLGRLLDTLTDVMK